MFLETQDALKYFDESLDEEKALSREISQQEFNKKFLDKVHCLIIAFIERMYWAIKLLYSISTFSSFTLQHAINSQSAVHLSEEDENFLQLSIFMKNLQQRWTRADKNFHREMEKLRSRSFSSSSLMCSSFHPLRVHLLRKNQFFQFILKSFFSKWTPNGQFFSVTTPVCAPTPRLWHRLSHSLSDFYQSLWLFGFKTIPKHKKASVEFRIDGINKMLVLAATAAVATRNRRRQQNGKK